MDDNGRLLKRFSIADFEPRRSSRDRKPVVSSSVLDSPPRSPVKSKNSVKRPDYGSDSGSEVEYSNIFTKSSGESSSQDYSSSSSPFGSDADDENLAKRKKKIPKNKEIVRKKVSLAAKESSSDEDWAPKASERAKKTRRVEVVSSSESDEESEDLDEEEDEDEDEEEDDEGNIKKKTRKLVKKDVEEWDPLDPQIDQVVDCPLNEDLDDEENLKVLIKWKGRSHLHNTWETISSLKDLKGFRKVQNFLKLLKSKMTWFANASREDQEIYSVHLELDRRNREAYTKVERIVASRNDEEGNIEYLAKWCGLYYANCTWEKEDDIRQNQEAIDSFLEREMNAPKISKKNIVKNFAEMKEQPKWIPNTDLALRDYQMAGVNWLLYSWSKGTNVILADEMGLGKTIQCISFIASLYHDYQATGPHLLVVPVTTMTAWKRELDKWAPFLNSVVYRGDVQSRSLCREYEFFVQDSKKPKFHVLLTSFELILKDRCFLDGFKFQTLIVDEAHRLKDSSTATYQELQLLHSDYRVLVTGTPLQNSLRELWCLLHFLQPEKFNDWDSFDATYGDVAQGEGISSLHDVLHPHLLRRVKKDVEKSLPNKIERILRVDMTPLQKKFYRLILTRNFDELNKGVKGSRSSLINIVMELKKCCNHPFLFESAEAQSSHQGSELSRLIANSGKLLLLDKLLIRLKETCHRVLIFSQMVRLLDILSDYLTLRGFQHQRLDGTMRSEDRQVAMDRFNHPDSKDFAFLLSTRAGGLGINLTSADTVIIFDSDWNPQNDMQAEARAHRIGQKKVVNIYRLVTKNSVEEDILERAKSKRILELLVIRHMSDVNNAVYKNDRSSIGKQQEKLSSSKKKDDKLFDRNELAKIIQFGARDLFDEANQEGHATNNDLTELDLDEILARAETTADESSETDKFLSAFKVANFSSLSWDKVEEVEKQKNEVDPNFWKNIIPENEITQALNGPENSGGWVAARKASLSVKSYAESELLKSSNDGLSRSGADTTVTKKKKGSSSNSGKNARVPADKQARHIYRTLLSLGNVELAVDDLIEGVLKGASRNDCLKMGNAMIEAAEFAVKDLGSISSDSKARISFNFESNDFDAVALIARIREMNVLRSLISKYNDPYQHFRISVKVNAPRKWPVTWGIKQDSMLLLGLHLYGMHNWDRFLKDANLGFECILDEQGQRAVSNSMLANRGCYLLKRILEESKLSNPGSQRRSKSSSSVNKQSSASKTDSNRSLGSKRNREERSGDPIVESSAKKSREENHSREFHQDDKLMSLCQEVLLSGESKKSLRRLVQFFGSDQLDLASRQKTLKTLVLDMGDSISTLLHKVQGSDVSSFEKHLWFFVAGMAQCPLPWWALKEIYLRLYKSDRLDAIARVKIDDLLVSAPSSI